jgi:hypothetical protein
MHNWSIAPVTFNNIKSAFHSCFEIVGVPLNIPQSGVFSNSSKTLIDSTMDERIRNKYGLERTTFNNFFLGSRISSHCSSQGFSKVPGSDIDSSHYSFGLKCAFSCRSNRTAWSFHLNMSCLSAGSQILSKGTTPSMRNVSMIFKTAALRLL